MAPYPSTNCWIYLRFSFFASVQREIYFESVGISPRVLIVYAVAATKRVFAFFVEPTCRAMITTGPQHPHTENIGPQAVELRVAPNPLSLLG